MRNFNSRHSGGKSSFNRRDSGERPSMHEAVCADCGRTCEVPFRPTGDKPVYCSNCFKKNKGSEYDRGDRGDRRDKRDFGKSSRFDQHQMFSAVCDKCHNKCEVPFKPSGEKEVLCSDCFAQNRNSGSRNTSSGPSNDQLKTINAKLDAILLALKPATKETAKSIEPAKAMDANKAKSKKEAPIASKQKTDSKKTVKKKTASTKAKKSKKK